MMDYSGLKEALLKKMDAQSVQIEAMDGVGIRFMVRVRLKDGTALMAVVQEDAMLHANDAAVCIEAKLREQLGIRQASALLESGRGIDSDPSLYSPERKLCERIRVGLGAQMVRLVPTTDIGLLIMQALMGDQTELRIIVEKDELMAAADPIKLLLSKWVEQNPDKVAPPIALPAPAAGQRRPTQRSSMDTSPEEILEEVRRLCATADRPGALLIVAKWQEKDSYATSFWQVGMNVSELIGLVEIQKARFLELMHPSNRKRLGDGN